MQGAQRQIRVRRERPNRVCSIVFLDHTVSKPVAWGVLIIVMQQPLSPIWQFRQPASTESLHDAGLLCSMRADWKLYSCIWLTFDSFAGASTSRLTAATKGDWSESCLVCLLLVYMNMAPNTMYAGFIVLVASIASVVHAAPTLRSSSMQKFEGGTGGLANAPDTAIAEQLASASNICF